MLALLPRPMLALLPKPIRRRIATLSILNNQRRILALSKSNKLIFLKPVSPRFCSGSVEHYYHFILDLVLPLNCLTKNTPDDVTFVLKDFGPFTERVQHLFPGRVKIENEIKVPNNLKRTRLIGMNPNGVYVTHKVIESFSQTIRQRCEVDQTGKPNKILLIERLPPDSYFTTEASKKGGGTLRRSIPNHADLESALRAIVKPPFELHNLRLEKINFNEQIDCFDKALIVIAQHGAGLANCLWMRPGSIVVELSNDESREHFRVISRLKKHQYHLYKTSSPHAAIDIEHFLSWMLSDVNLKGFFQETVAS